MMAEDFINTEIGPIRFGLRYSLGGSPRLQWFKFDETDPETSREILQKKRELTFCLEAKQFDKHASDFSSSCNPYVHLGANVNRSQPDDELSIVLVRRLDNRWIPKTGKDTDVDRIRKQYWRAAHATATLCVGPGRPLLRQDGNPVQVKIALGYKDDWYEKIYHDILESLSYSHERVEAHIASSFELFMSTIKQARKEAEGSSALELYYRLKQILPEFERALSDILRAPSSQFVPHLSFFQLDRDTAHRFFHARRGQVEFVSVRSAARRGGKIIPTSFVGLDVIETIDSTANGYVRYAVDRVRGLIGHVESSVDEFIDAERQANKRFMEQEKRWRTRSPIYHGRLRSIEQHEEKRNELSGTLKRFSLYTQRIPKTSFALGSEVSASSVLYYDPRYSRLQHLTELLDFILRYVDTDEDCVPFEVDAFHALYERWCFVKMVEALKLIGFKFTKEGIEVTPLYHHPVSHQVNCEMVHDRLPTTLLKVWYDRRYPKYENRLQYGLETRYRQGRTSYEQVDPDDWGRPKRTPDIALEFWDTTQQQSPDIVTFDATLGSSKSILRTKYEYREAIRCFHSHEEKGKESRKIVRAAWAIHPESSREKLTSYFDLDQDNNFTKGSIILRPDKKSEDMLPQTLRTILEQTGLM